MANFFVKNYKKRLDVMENPFPCKEQTINQRPLQIDKSFLEFHCLGSMTLKSGHERDKIENLNFFNELTLFKNVRFFQSDQFYFFYILYLQYQYRFAALQVMNLRIKGAT